MGTLMTSQRPRVGDQIRVRGMSGTYLMVANDDPSLVTVESSLGTRLRVGERAITEVISFDRTNRTPEKEAELRSGVRPWPTDPVEQARLDGLLATMRDGTASRDARAAAAIELAPYFHREAGTIEIGENES